ncbi:MAG TPA: ATP-binding protein [Puia sp.]|nr:ATP-binding protein [Puia sp.]
MRRVCLLGLLLVFSIPKTFAQNGQVFHLNKLLEQDTLLTGWKFHPGDDSRWANPGFDDSKWELADPGTDITKFDQLKNAGVGWLRLHIRADSVIAGQQIMAWVLQYSASEIYLDGKLIQRYGYIGHDPAKTIAVTPVGELFELKIKGGVNQVIAVRLGNQSGILYISPLFIPLPAFSMYVNGYKGAKANSENSSRLNQELLVMNSIAAGIFLILCFIHFFYFVFDRSQKISLYYLIYCACILYIYITFIFIYYQGHAESVSTNMLIFDVGTAAFCVAFLFLVLVVYVLFGYRGRAVFKILVVLALATFFSIVPDDIIGSFIASIVFPVLCMLEVLRICILALKQKKKDAAIVVPVICLYIILYIWEGLLDQTTVLATLLIYFVFLGLPIAISIYLGLKTATTNRALITTLAEVQTLSAQNLLKEQEKQQILADQNILLETQVNERTSELNQSLTHLKQTQTQLIQSEKMASLGELTAGIAHEIQNPLNFVNNFSEVNKELLAEMNEEIQNGNYDEVKTIAKDLTDNEEKINHHGKRAGAIVKGMLQHSRSSTGQKEPVNINDIADECLRLSYHGLRARDKSFNANLKTDFDDTIDKIPLIQQDIVRVLVNLYNNAFYAVDEKSKQRNEGYVPTVSLSTKKINDKVVLTVMDNGNGIPQKLVDKIFQPFFTTKPTGQGTGLGLSLSYDIVKAHGGEIKVETKENEGSEFIIELPLNK